MQPYFFPGLGYFDLIGATDRWVVFDTPQYRRRSWMNRNRILHPQRGWQYVQAPVEKHSLGAPISDIRVVAGDGWKRRLVAQLTHYRGRAPYFERTRELVERVLAAEERRLARICGRALAACCELLGLSVELEYFSEMDVALGPIEGPGDWALRISEALGATTYVNPPGGRHLFDPAAFAASGVGLEIRTFPDLVYEPRGFAFEPGLSIIDVLMWCSVETIQEHLASLR